MYLIFINIYFLNSGMIMKTNHSSSRYHIIRNKANVDWKMLRKDFAKWLKENIYYTRKEWQ
jgi:hypothetical protein